MADHGVIKPCGHKVCAIINEVFNPPAALLSVCRRKAACQAPRPRKATRPSRASQTRRLDGKAKRGAVKQLRQRKPGHE